MIVASAFGGHCRGAGEGSGVTGQGTIFSRDSLLWNLWIKKVCKHEGTKFVSMKTPKKMQRK